MRPETCARIVALACCAAFARRATLTRMSPAAPDHPPCEPGGLRAVIAGAAARLRAELLATLAPPACLACREPLPEADAQLCVGCRRVLPWLPAPRCDRCGLPQPCAPRGGGCPAAGA